MTQTDRAAQVYHTAVATPSNSLQHVAASIRQAHDLADTREQAPAGNSWPLPAVSTPTRVLIVDDAESSMSLELLLHALGFWTTRVAVTGATALEMAQEFSPSVVLLALDLPDMSAYDVAQQLRERTELRRVRLIALTLDYEHTGRDQARQAGFERYLAKPVTAAALQHLLRANLS